MNSNKGSLRSNRIEPSAALTSLALWSTLQTAQFLGVAPVTVRTWRRLGTGPKYLAPTPRMVRYKPQDVQEWLEKRVKTSTNSAKSR